ncbi:MAG: YIP1 family protein [Chloroflexota bacterium]|nr:YIP1 family protein [Chloroflexota bacterium]
MANEQVTIEKERGFFALLRGILWRPRATLNYLSGARRRWWALLALAALAAGALQGVAFRLTDAEYRHQQQQQQAEQLERPRPGVEMPMMEYASPHPLIVWVPVLGQTLGSIASWLIWAGAFYLAGTFFGQNGAKFGALLAMTIWAGTPYMLRNLLQGIYMLVTRVPIYNQGLAGLVWDSAPQAMAFGNDFFMPMMPGTGQLVAAALLGKVDFYWCWNIWLLVLGVMAFVKLSRKKALLVTLGLWLLFTLPSLLPALVGLGGGGMAY